MLPRNPGRFRGSASSDRNVERMKIKRRVSTRGEPHGNGLERLIELQTLMQMQISKADERMARSDERMARSDERLARLEQELNQRFARIDERFARIDERFAHIEQVLGSVVRMIEALPDAVRDKIGFAPVKP
jgi:hypothetical protein